MLNIFKSSNQIVKEIHNEFDTAEDRLLEQADLLLKELNIPTETSIEKKASDLRSLGFVNSEVVKVAESLTQKRKEANEKLVSTKEQAELIRYYKYTYPFQKFLTEQELERICAKYNLIFAPVANYLEDVPEKNIKEIIASKNLLQSDAATDFNYFKVTGYYYWSEKLVKHIKEQKFKIPDTDLRLFKLVPWSECNKLLSKIYPNESDSIGKEFEVITESKQGLFIAAPQSHFNLKGLTKKGRFSFLNIVKTEVKDPIVFRYCRGGIQVLSKWGLEASDEALVNEIEN